ncbi:MAG: DUF6159 family protein [Phycisphaeraceae bacterium]
MGGESTFSCLTCQKQYRWKPELAGQRVRCKCGNKMHVPDTPEQAAGGEIAAQGGTAHVGKRQCPSCSEAIAADAVLCVHCGFNLQTNQALTTSVGRAVKQAGPAGSRRTAGPVGADGFFGRLRRSWEYVKLSYSIIWDFKQLLVFPLLSGLASLVVIASFVLPMAGTGTLEQLDTFLDEETAAGEVPLLVYVLAFAFYFCSYFVIVFFNTALSACALRVCAGETPTVGYGLSVAMRRLPQIAGWALVSATVGLLLKIIENANDKVGAVVAAILGTGWTILTYFVVPVLAAEGVGPVRAFKQALSTLKQTWGEALVGNFSMTLLTFLVTLPVFIVLGVLVGLAVASGQLLLIITAVVLFALAVILAVVASSAADMVFRSLLYNYATGRTIPDDVDEELLAAAFGSKSTE